MTRKTPGFPCVYREPDGSTASLRTNKADMPGVFEKNDAEDTVLVEGDVDFDAPDEIRVINNEKLTFGVV